MYLCVRGIDFDFFYEFSVGVWNCFESVVFLVTPPLFYEVPVPSQESDQSCIYVFGLSILAISMSFLLMFGVVTRVWYFLFIPPCFIKWLYQLFYEVPVPSQGIERPCIYVLGTTILPLSRSFL